MELSGPAPLGAQAAIAAQVQQRRPVDVQKVDPGRQTDSSGTDARQRPEQDQTAASARDITDLRDRTRQQARQRDLPAGPSPAFEVSLLEMASDLKQVIARIESARNQERDAQAVKAPAEAEAAQLRADMAAEEARAAAAQATAEAASTASQGASTEIGPSAPAAPSAAPTTQAPPAEPSASQLEALAQSQDVTTQQAAPAPVGDATPV